LVRSGSMELGTLSLFVNRDDHEWRPGDIWLRGAFPSDIEKSISGAWKLAGSVMKEAGISESVGPYLFTRFCFTKSLWYACRIPQDVFMPSAGRVLTDFGSEWLHVQGRRSEIPIKNWLDKPRSVAATDTYRRCEDLAT